MILTMIDEKNCMGFKIVTQIMPQFKIEERNKSYKLVKDNDLASESYLFVVHSGHMFSRH